MIIKRLVASFRSYGLSLLLVCFLQPVLTGQKLTDYVNPFIGTTNFGATNPGAVVPQGMVSVVPFNVSGSEENTYRILLRSVLP